MARPRSLAPLKLFDVKLTDMVYRLALLALTDKEIGEVFGISESRVNRWKKQTPEFEQAINRGRTQADSEVIHSLYQRAVGYSHPEEVVQWDHKNSRWQRTITTKHYPPSETAAIFWLINRQRGQGRWMDVRSPLLNVNLAGVPVSPDALALARALAQEQLDGKPIDLALPKPSKPAKDGDASDTKPG